MWQLIMLFFFSSSWLLECCSGVERVKTDQENQMVTVTGMSVNPMRVLRRVKKIKKRSELIMPNWIPTEKHGTSNYAAESAKSYSRYPQSSSQVHTQQLYQGPGEEFNYPHNFYARPSYHHHWWTNPSFSFICAWYCRSQTVHNFWSLLSQNFVHSFLWVTRTWLLGTIFYLSADYDTFVALQNLEARTQSTTLHCNRRVLSCKFCARSKKNLAAAWFRLQLFCAHRNMWLFNCCSSNVPEH
jgi:hypothetical protein